ncbi:MAG: hypothetical protein CMJ06_01540 [Pelagibacterales bacterium]|nr:hypothetical protein [Pelagibacterales bacterium]OUU63344.1 MAG: hypothetical protein CBC22_01510 [Alphaproteobacteria bacterium TMED62]|tara:strand:- start:3534 stop:4124 length:591 start_codon:yes stop_codon:yes gene_type:complete
MKKVIFVMSKVPIKGIMKNRLSKDIGFTNSKRLVCNSIEKINKIFIRKKNEYSLHWYLTPRSKFRSYSFSIFNNCILQNKGNLGDKMWDLTKIQRQPFIILGSDIPNLNLLAISNSFKKLKKNDVVIGPTYDGGFWLIGFSNKKRIINPFINVRWSNSFTLSDLIKNLNNNKMSFDFVEKLRDIDNAADYCDYIHD